VSSRGWFTTFTPFQSTLAGHIAFGGPGSAVEGIGNVSLKLYTDERDLSKYKSIVLKDVLYVPSLVCNIIGQPS
jgi:hypothetical protein